jgi:hypothetical protein
VRRLLVGCCMLSGLSYGQTQVDLSRQAKGPDFSGMAHTRPVQVGAALPATCSLGDLFFRTNSLGGQNLFGCVENGGWVQISGLGGCVVDSGNSLTCPGDILSGDGSTAGELSLFELSANGSEYISWLSPDSIPATYRLRFPQAQPAAGQVIAFAAPANGIAQGSWMTLGSGGSIDPTVTVEHDEFLSTPAMGGNGPFGQLGWQAAGSGVNYTATSSANPWAGLVEISTNSVAGSLAGIHLGGYNFSTPWLVNAATATGWEFRFSFKSDPYFTTQYVTRVGLVNSLNQEPTDGIWVKVANNTACTNAGNDVHWMYQARAGGTGPAPTDSTVSYAANAYYTVRVRSTQAGQALYSVSMGGGAFTAETAISISTTAALAPVFEVWGCDAVNHRMIVDRFDAVLRR